MPPREHHERRTPVQQLALVYTDLVDSTALNARLGDAAMQALWDWHDGCSRDLLRRFGGRETARGDGLVAVFEQPEAASRFAIEYQRALSSRPERPRARVGVHCGPLSVRENDREAIAVGAAGLDATGLAKAVCARLMGLAAGGQILASTALVCSTPPATVQSRAQGHWRLKGLDEPVEVHELAIDGRYGMPPTDVEKAYRVVLSGGVWSALAAQRSRLPSEADGFHGRNADLCALAARFDGGCRLVSLVGTGGIGKTRLALRYAWGWAGAFAGGAYFCDLAAAHDADGIISAAARALTLPLGANPLAQLGDALAGRGRCLVLLDNAEQVAEPMREAVGRWLDAAPEAVFLVTSRERLGIAGEHTQWLDPLTTDEAMDLFEDRARAVRPQGAADESDAVRTLVQRLDCLPLAIELAAARVSAFGPQVLLQRLSERFALLTRQRSGVTVDRQATLWAALDWSWRLLTPGERAVLAQASIFTGGFDLGAAEAVLRGAPGPSAAPVFDLLQSLCDKSLVRPPAGGRFTLLQGVRDFAALRLAEPDAPTGLGPVARDAARRRHLRHYAGRSQAQIDAAAGVDLDDLAAACRGASDADEMNDGVACLELAWSLLRLGGPFALAIDLARGLAERVTERAHCARVQWVLGSALFAARSTAEAGAAAEAGLQALETLADDRLGARLHGLYGEVLTIQGAFDRGMRQLEAAWACAERSADPALRCTVLNARGALAADQGDAAQARSFYEQLQREAEEAQDTRWQACALGNLAVLLMEAGAFDAAAQRAERSLELALQCGDERWAGNARCNLGLIGLETGRLDASGRHLEQALVAAARLGHRALEVTTEANLGLLAERQGKLAVACERHRRAVAGARRLGDARLEAQLRACLVSALACAGNSAEAGDVLVRALELAEPCDPITRGLVCCSAAEHHATAGDRTAAAVHVERAKAMQTAAGATDTSELGRRVAVVQALIDGGPG
jgi:predicted ATPase/class 3 adenylate cyclase